MAILISGREPRTICELMGRAPTTGERWYGKIQLTVNSEKTSLITFTKKKKIEGHQKLCLGKAELQLQEEVKYLGIILDKILDKKPSWRKQIKNITAQAAASLNLCRRVVGKTWGLSPKNIRNRHPRKREMEVWGVSKGNEKRTVVYRWAQNG